MIFSKGFGNWNWIRPCHWYQQLWLSNENLQFLVISKANLKTGLGQKFKDRFSQRAVFLSWGFWTEELPSFEGRVISDWILCQYFFFPLPGNFGHQTIGKKSFTFQFNKSNLEYFYLWIQFTTPLLLISTIIVTFMLRLQVIVNSP